MPRSQRTPISVFLFFFLLTTSSYAQTKPELRLPESVAPTSYRAELTLDPAKDSFSGLISIKVDVKQRVKTIWLNATQISASEASLKTGGQTFLAKASPSGDDFLSLEFPREIPKGAAELLIRYTGKVRQDNSSGVFLGKDNGNKYIFTQFESTDARGAFPCFDEPSYKVPWQLTLHVPVGDTAVSNTPIEQEHIDGNLQTYVFKPTKPLPSYLVAFGVGPFECVDAGKAGKKQFPVRIVVPKGHAKEAKYAAEVTATILTRLEDYFGIPFPYEKSDQVSMPVSFGAMENPGMVTYGQTIILSDPARDTVDRQRGYASIAAHELAHQWFGDLVTTAWWNDIWLNEAFATWMEEKLLAEWKPEWNTRVEDVATKISAEQSDSLVSARKIRQEIVKKDDIDDAFDGITYLKGSAVIGMFERYVGEAEFRKGVQSYLKQYAFRNATAPEFLDAISSSSKKDVGKAFSTFLNQPGVPVVSASLDCRQESSVLHLEQQRSLPLGTKSDQPLTWSIPMCIRYAAGDASEKSCFLLDKPKLDMKLNGKSCPTWVQLNDNASGYYQVDYKGELLQKLLSNQSSTNMNAAERVDLMGNISSAVDAGRLPLTDELKLAELFHSDSESHVARSAIGIAIQRTVSFPVPKQWVPVNLAPNYQRFIRNNFGARAHQLGWNPKPGEPDDLTLLRPSLLAAVAMYGGDQDLAKEAQDLATAWLADHSSVNANVVWAVLRTAAYYGDKSLMNRYLDTLKNTTDRQVREELFIAMIFFRDPEAVEIGMQSVLAGEVPLSDGGFYLLVLAGRASPATKKIPFEFIKAHYDEILAKRPPIGIFDYSSAFPNVGSSFCDAQSKAELKDFFDPRVDKLLGARHTLNETLEGIDICIATREAQLPSLEAFLSKY